MGRVICKYRRECDVNRETSAMIPFEIDNAVTQISSPSPSLLSSSCSLGTRQPSLTPSSSVTRLHRILLSSISRISASSADLGQCYRSLLMPGRIVVIPTEIFPAFSSYSKRSSLAVCGTIVRAHSQSDNRRGRRLFHLTFQTHRRAGYPFVGGQTDDLWS